VIPSNEAELCLRSARPSIREILAQGGIVFEECQYDGVHSNKLILLKSTLQFFDAVLAERIVLANE
jgi:hypothetical protein